MLPPASSPRPLVTCPACEGPLNSVGRLPLRRDSVQAGYVVPADPEDAQPAIGLDVYRCHSCGRIQFYDHDFQLPGS